MQTAPGSSVKEMKETMEATSRTFNSITDINKRPTEISWTAAQVMQHLVLSNGGFVDIMRGSVIDSDRDPGQSIPMIRSIFLDFTTKMQSPDFIVPKDEAYDKSNLLSKFDNIKENLVNIMETEDLSKLCTAFKLPQMGFLTRLEAVHFVLYHTQRHTHQLEKIQEALAKIEVPTGNS
ncbi:MAG: DinB family protein [Bacteroidota bacterium]|nr:DinB family protein [Ferruginibacter sp.]